MQRLPLGEVLRLVLTGRHDRMTAQRALEPGLVSEVVPAANLLDRVRELADMIARNSPAVIAQSRAAIKRLSAGRCRKPMHRPGT
jgi:enoyl-CoA hydratase/carnithine racemase